MALDDDPTDMPLGRSIGRAHKFTRMWGDSLLAPLDGSVTEWIVLFHIAAADPPGASQSEVARFSDMGGPALVRHIDRLEADGLVTRTRDDEDRRVVRLALTDAGHDRLAALRDVMASADATLRAVLTEEEAHTMQVALGKVFRACIDALGRAGVLTGPTVAFNGVHRRLDLPARRTE